MRRPTGGAILGGIILAAAAVCGCGRSDNAGQAATAASAPSVMAVAAALKSVTPSGTFVGRVQAVNTVNLVSRVEGFLQKRVFTEGQQVKTGDLLFVIEQDTYQAAVDQAQAQLASAQATERNAALALQRSQELVKTNAVAQATVDQNLANQGTAAAAVRSAEAAVEQANINLAFTEIKAPIDGRIGMANVSVGILSAGRLARSPPSSARIRSTSCFRRPRSRCSIIGSGPRRRPAQAAKSSSARSCRTVRNILTPARSISSTFKPIRAPTP
jgi:membrane fusion protein (multidrug efflux system)